ncbi:MAG: AgmX/PglI C-terminal domain-containing protein [Deltaproteobacteria bacterium]|nr:AgmX/PglI C-terminal domain-containing protein [Deltaproteobacteria bacterium]
MSAITCVLLTLTILQEPDPVAERAAAVAELLAGGHAADALAAVGDDELRHRVVLAARDLLLQELGALDEGTDDRVEACLTGLVALGFGGALDGQAQGEALLWAEALWDQSVRSTEAPRRADAALAAVLRALDDLGGGARDEWARRVLEHAGIPGLAATALGPREGSSSPPWLASRRFRTGPFLDGVMEAWVAAAGDPARALAVLAPLGSSPMVLDRLLAVQGLKRLGTPEAEALLEEAQDDSTGAWRYLEGHTVGSQAARALSATGLARELDALRADLVAAGADTTGLDGLKRDLLGDLEPAEAVWRSTWDPRVRDMSARWGALHGSAAEARRQGLHLLYIACRKEVDQGAARGLPAQDPAAVARVADACLARLERELDTSAGLGTVFGPGDARAAVELALRARDRAATEEVRTRALAYLRAATEAAYDTPRGRREVDGLTVWTLEDPATGTVVRRILDVAFEQALADGRAPGPARDGAPGLLAEELETFRAEGDPGNQVLALLIGLRWHLLWRDAGTEERSLLREAAWARFDEAYWKGSAAVRTRFRSDPFTPEILRDLARDGADVAALRWSLPPEDRPLLDQVRRDLERSRRAAATTAVRTSGIREEVLGIFMKHHPALEEIASVWLLALSGARARRPPPAALAEPRPPENPLDLRRPGPPASAFTDVVHESWERVRACYDERRKLRPGLRGSLQVDIEVSTGGEVAVRIADDGLGDPQVASCVLRTLQRLKYPTPKNSAFEFRVPFQFEP